MCTGYRGVFRMQPIGNMGGRPVDRPYMESVMERARDLNRACRPKLRDSRDDARQLCLPWGAGDEKESV